MASALGSSSNTATTGPAWFDIRNYGARAGDPNGIDAALSALWANLPPLGTPVTIYIPDSPLPWYVNDPIWIDRDYVTVRGAGPDATTLQPVYGRNVPVILQGIQRAPNGVSLTADHWVDLYGVMDSRFAPSPGQNWGYRTKGDSHLTFWSGPLAHGPSDYWSTTTQLTIDFATDTHGALFAQCQNFIGMNGSRGPRPWSVQFMTNNVLRFAFRTSEQDGFNQGFRYFTFAVPLTATGAVRVSIQVDLAAASVQAFVKNGASPAVQVACSAVGNTNGSGPAFAAASNLRFLANETDPFNVGIFSCSSFDNEVGYGPFDVTLYGLKVSKGLRYQNNGVGQPQVAAVGGSTPDDSYRYGYDGFSEIAYLTLSDGPAGKYGGRLVHYVANKGNPPSVGGTCMGLFLSTGVQGGGNYCVKGTTLRDLGASSQMRYGDCISVGGAVDYVNIENVKTVGGWRGVGAINMGASWPVLLRDVYLSNAYDCSYYGVSQIITAENVNCQVPGTSTIRLKGCEANFTNVWVGIHQVPDATRPVPYDTVVKIHHDQYGGDYQFNNLNFDGENAAFPTFAMYYMENHLNTLPCSLVLRDPKVGFLNPAAAAVVLKDFAPPGTTGFHPATFRMEGLTDFGQNSNVYVRTDGPLWRGDVENFSFSDTVPHVENTGANGIGNVVWHYRGDYTAPPCRSAWGRGSHDIDVPNAADGQYGKIRCAQTGQYGTAARPVWVGYDPLDLSGGGLAGYVLSEDHVSANLN